MSANIRHSSENSEFMTPQWITDWAHYVMGGIDLDPASCAEANRTVRAEWYFDKAQNGLFQPWHGKVWLNPPGGLVDEAGREVIRARTIKDVRYPGCTENGACGLPPGHKHTGIESSAVFWWHKLMHEFSAGRVECAMFLGFSLELLQSVQTFQGPHPLDFPCSIPKQRIRFEVEIDGVRKQASDPTHANVIALVTPPIYQCSKLRRFEEAFKQVGYVHVPRGY